MLDYTSKTILVCFTASLLSAAAQNAPSSADTNNPVRLAPVVVEDHAGGDAELREDQPFGPNQQPEWTTRRRFATTRVYVLPPWQAEFEQWWQGTWPQHGGADHLFQSEVSVGLPYRFQFDLYDNYGRAPGEGLRQRGVQLEGRWALADWGRIPLNPTLYGEYKFNNHDPDTYEVKLLLGEDLAPRWHWGVNVFYEQEVSGGRVSAVGFSQALSYTLVDEKLGVGVEMKLERGSSPNFQGSPALEFLLGPSLQWRPTPRTHLDLVPLFGTTSDSPALEAFVVFGFDFGPKGNHQQIQAPASSQSR